MLTISFPANRQRLRASRKPLLGSFISGGELPRTEERVYWAGLFQAPPRNIRRLQSPPLHTFPSWGASL